MQKHPLRDCIRLREVLKGEARFVGYNLPLIFDGLMVRASGFSSQDLWYLSFVSWIFLYINLAS